MVTPPARESVLAGVTYWSRDLGPYVWHEFDPERVRADLRAMASAQFRVVRTLLPWDRFMPTPERVDDSRLRDLEVFLDVAAQETLSVIPVLFAQSIGDCVMLPVYAIDVGVKRPGVRAVTDGVVQPGAPRDQYTDARMLEAELVWLDSMLAAFAGHPAVAMWDLGHDPANVMRPRRIDDMVRWAQLLKSRAGEREQQCMLTLSSRDVTTARGVRLGALAPSLDALGFDVDPKALGFTSEAVDARPLVFVTQLALRLAGGVCPLYVHVDAPLPADAARFAAEAADALADIGSAARFAAAWSDGGPRTATVPPFDTHPELRMRGIVDITGERTAFGAAWLARVAAERERQTPEPWPDDIDVVEYYANLPESISDLYAGWRGASSDGPAMLG